MVALGPLTNLADALGDLGPHAVPALQRLLVMGGAIAVHGNVGRAIPGGNDSAEWNVFVDPLAARRVLRSGIGLTLVPLDATNHVPIDRPFLDAYSARVPTRLGAVVAHVFDEARGNMAAGAYYAWDPLACVGLVDSQVLSVRPAVLDVALTGAQRGVTFVRPGAPAGVTIAFDADAARFRQVFIEALTTPARRPGPE
jgi:inosine-uridine nucleoside N-ribohydrolase